jgi:hypothetical protein
MPAFSKLLLAASLVASAAAGPIVFHHDVPAAPVAAAGAAAGAGSESEMAKLAEQVKALTQTVSAQQAQLKDAQAKPPAAPMSDLESRQRAAIIAEADKIFFKNDDNHDGKLTVNEMVGAALYFLSISAAIFSRLSSVLSSYSSCKQASAKKSGMMPHASIISIARAFLKSFALPGLISLSSTMSDGLRLRVFNAFIFLPLLLC